MEFIAQFAIIILVGVISGIVALRFRAPLIVGYIIGGAVLSVIAGEQFDLESIKHLGEVGIALLLFSIGIEFSITKLIELRKFAVYGGIAQIILTVILGVLVFPIFGFSSYEAFFLGAVFAFSSTAVVVKVLEDIGQLETHASQIIIGWLILQDIAVVIVIGLLGNFATADADFGALFETVLKSGVLIVLAIVVGKRVIPRILTSISKLGSREIMVVSALSYSLLFAFLSEELGVSFTLGAFLAGVMISDSFLHHEIFSEIKPLQNIFAMFFFIVIGTLFSFNYLFENILLVTLVLGIIIVGKFTVVILINLVLKMHIRNAVEVAIGLAQIGEFAFLISQIGLESSWIDADLNNLIISVTIFSLLLSPLLILKSDAIYERIRDYFMKRSPKLYRRFFMAEDEDVRGRQGRKNHSIIIGFGRVGRYVALALRRLRYKLVVTELNTELVDQAKKLGIDTIYGDATSEEILIQAGVKNAKTVVIALPKEAEVLTIASKVEALNPDVKIIIRRHNSGKDFEGIDHYAVIEPEFEAAIKIMERMLKLFGKRDRKVIRWLRGQQELLK